MPTTRPRHILTETDEIAAAIDGAVPEFPEASRADVLRQLVLVGAETLASRRHRRAIRVRLHAGRFAGLYPHDHVAALRDEWPE